MVEITRLPKLKVVHISPEVKPYFHTGGGPSDIVGKLPKMLQEAGLQTQIIMPAYRQILTSNKLQSLKDSLSRNGVAMNGDSITPEVYSAAAEEGSPKVYMIGGKGYFDLEHPYCNNQDDLERFAFFSLASIQLMKKPGEQRPDVIVCHEWQTGLVPAYLRTIFKNDPFFANTKTVFVMHDIGIQGNFPHEFFTKTGLGWHLFTPKHLEFHGWISLGKAGMIFSDATVVRSLEYAQRIQSHPHGQGFEGIAKELAEGSRLLGMVESDKTWVPTRPFTDEIAEAWKGAEIALFRSLVKTQFEGMERATQTYPLREFLSMTVTEHLKLHNPKVSEFYPQLAEADRNEIDRFVGHQQSHIFDKIETMDELKALVQDLRKISDETLLGCQKAVEEHVRTGGRSSLLSGEKKLLSDIPPLEVTGDKIQAGLEKRQYLARVVPASGDPGRWLKALKSEEDLDKYGLSLTGKALEAFKRNKLLVVKGCFRIKALGDRSFYQLKIDDWAENQKGLEKKMPIYFLTSPGEVGEIVEAHFQELGFVQTYYDSERRRKHFIRKSDGLELVSIEEKEDTYVPAFTKTGKLAMLPDGKRLRLLFPGHGIIYQALFESGAIDDMESRGARTIFLTNIDNLGGTAGDDHFYALLGYHKEPFTAEMVDPKNDSGGVGIRRKLPGQTEWRRQIGELFTLEIDMQQEANDSNAPFNPAGYLLDIVPLRGSWDRGELKGGGEHGLTRYVEERVDGENRWYKPLILAGDVSEKIMPDFVKTLRAQRFIPCKAPQDPNFQAYLASLDKQKT